MIFREDCGYVRSPRVQAADDLYVRAAHALCGENYNSFVLPLHDSMYGYRIDTDTAAREELARQVREMKGTTIDMEPGDRAILRTILGSEEAVVAYLAATRDTPVPLTTNGATHEQEEGSSQRSRAEGSNG